MHEIKTTKFNSCATVNTYSMYLQTETVHSKFKITNQIQISCDVF